MTQSQLRRVETFLFSWDGSMGTVSALFTSDHLFASLGIRIQTRVKFDGVEGVCGDAYVFFLSANELTCRSTE
jgi:hypothetical protein